MNIEFEVNNNILKICDNIEDSLLFFDDSEDEVSVLSFDDDTDYTNQIIDFGANEQVLEYDSDMDYNPLTFTQQDNDDNLIEIITDDSDESLLNYNYNQYKASFRFTGEIWDDIDKFAIFVDSWSNSCIVHLGEENEMECTIPSNVLKGTFFKVSVYGGDLITTNNVTIHLEMSGYIDFINSNPMGANHECGGSKDIFVEIFEQLDTMVNSVTYSDKFLHLYGNDGLLDSVYLPFITEEEKEALADDLFEEFNIIINNVIDSKADMDSISTVGLTGDYNDLTNIPSSFTPSNHTHTVDDVTDFEDNTGVEIKKAYNILINQIRRYGE